MKKLITLSFLLFSIILSTAQNRYWVATGTVTGWNNTANWSTTSGGAGGASVPGSTVTAIFDGGSTVNCDIDAAVNVLGLTTTTAYPGTISQNSYTVTIGTSGASLSGGTFTGGSVNISVSGNFILSGSTFTSTSAALLLKKDYTFSGGTFSHNNGTVIFSATSALTGSATFYNLQFFPTATSTFTITSGTTLTVNQTLTLNGTESFLLNTGNIEAQGNITINNTGKSGGGTALITINGTGDQTLTGSGISDKGKLCKVTIDKSAGTLFISSIVSIANDWTYVQGTVDALTNNSTVAPCATLLIDAQGTSNTMAFNHLTVFSGSVTAAGNLEVKGDLTISSNQGFSSNGYKITLGGNWINSKTFHYLPGDEIVFNGSTLQTITRSAGAENFSNLTVNKPSNKLQLNSALTINNALVLTKGIVKTYTLTILTLADNATVSGGSDSSYVNGPMRKTGDDAFVFPLGDTTLTTGAYHPLGISTPSVTTDQFEARYYGTVQTLGSTLADSFASISGCEYWTLKRNAGSSDVNATLNWNSSGCNVSNLCKINVAQWDASISKWIGLGNHNASYSLPTGSVTSTVPPNSNASLTFGYTTPGLIVNSGNQSICYGSSVQLSASGSGSFSWTPSSGLSSTTVSNPVASPTTTTTYTVTMSNTNGCQEKGIVTITVYPVPTLTVCGNQSICYGASVQLSASGSGSFLWTPSTGLSSTTVSHPVASPTITITYTVTLTNTYGCSERGIITVTVYPVTGLTLAGHAICYGATVQLSASGIGSFSWSHSTGLSGTTIPNPLASPTITTTYTVTLINVYGCHSQTTVTVTVYPRVRYWVGDGTNTSWSNSSNWSISPGGTGGLCVPTSNDTVYFGGGGTGNCDIDVSVHINGLITTTAYPGVISQNSYTVTIGTEGINLKGGTFTGGSANIVLNGPFNQDAGTFTSTSATLFVKSNFTRSGGTFNHNSGLVLFKDSSNQTISNSTGTQTFYNVTVNKSGGRLRLNSPVDISSNLTLTRGIITTTVSNYLSLLDNATVTGGSDSSYVHGPMRKTGNDAFTFPLGDTVLTAGAYHPLGISTPSVTTDQFEARYFAANQTLGNTLEDTIESISTCEYWTLKNTAGNAKISTTLNWNAGGCDVTNLSNILVTQWDVSSSKWISLGGINLYNAWPLGSITTYTAQYADGSATFTFGYPNLIQNNMSYALLKRTLDAEYYITKNNLLLFKVDDEYNDLSLLKYKIYNSSNQDVAPGLAKTALNKPVTYYGDNRISIELKTYSGLLPAGYYILEVTSEKNEKKYLRFKI